MGTDVLKDAVALEEDEFADVIVVGSGIAGISIAYELQSAGLDVIVVDRGPIAGGMTSRTTGHLTAQCDDGFQQMLARRGADLTKAWFESQTIAIDRIEAVQRDLEIGCHFRRLNGFLFKAPSTSLDEFEKEFAATKQVGMRVVRQKGVPFIGQDSTAVIVYPNQATFHPLRYLAGLAKALSRNGVRFYAQTPVTEIQENDTGVVVGTSDRHRLRAAHAVVATNSPINDRYAIHTKQAPYRTYAMAFSISGESLPDGLYWDTLDPYHYVRRLSGTGKDDILIVGGADHKTGEADDADARFLAIESWMRNLLPSIGRERNRWSGQVLDTIDYAAFIGKNPGNRRIFVATGDFGQGMTHGVVASLLIRDLIIRGSSPWSEVYEPSRKPMKAAVQYLTENLGALKNLADYLAPGEVSSTDDLRPGEGAIVRMGLEKLAAYRKSDGELILRSASCTHRGCHLHWNSFESCWDCPCHGSQFAPDGTVLNGPATHPLSGAAKISSN